MIIILPAVLGLTTFVSCEDLLKSDQIYAEDAMLGASYSNYSKKTIKSWARLVEKDENMEMKLTTGAKLVIDAMNNSGLEDI